ncbi:EF-hand domain-containing protein [Silicimonas algicola]|uniref:EF hand domain-containing protein n=1 Tax=Silicimonas algicola TaxID=1826607 RepID=A0A316GAM4_9RHOB|nr:calcium-binding protein [Silicimonas algicola]AZQ67563.1 EF-hand domain-containing protein [Silicimonas algicola]PWK57265.1 EF hand domain-containing protein [Silicimonas algicola]
MTKIWTVLAAALLGLGATAATAADVTDTDGDGMYSMEEIQAAYPDLTEEVFATIDANADGMVDADELAAAETAGTLVAG